jgi:hypothetical protein
LVICCSYSNAQQVDTTGNLINNSQWSGAVYGADPNDCCSNPGGSQPLYDTGSNTIKFSYGQATVGQAIGINNALGSSGVQINGYNWSFDARNNNGGNAQSGTDLLTSYSYLQDGNGNVLASASTRHTTLFDWTNFSGTQTLNNPYDISGGGQLGIQFSGSDGGFWAGLYGPEVRNVNLRLNYSAAPIDPCTLDPLYSTTCPGYGEAFKAQQCALNPLYDQTCAGYGGIVASDNLVPNPSGSSGWFGGTINNSFAINQALSHSGSGVMIHGFEWGYRANNFSGFGLPLGSSSVGVNIRDGNGSSLYSWSRQNTAPGSNSYSSSYVLPQSRNNTTLGNFDYTASSSGFGSVDNMWARALFTPDSCSPDPLSSVLCTGYQAAFLEQQCSLNALYSPSCPGYIDAFNAMLASAIPETTTTVSDPVAEAAAASTVSAPQATSDPTATGAETTVDLGGAELSTTGEIQISDGIPSDVKESVKESATADKKEETKTAESSDKKKSRVNAVALAQSAARDAEKTALSVAGEATAASLSDAANPDDGIGLGDLGSGIAVPGLRLLGLGNDQNSSQAVNQALDAAAARSREQSNQEETLADADSSAQKENTANELASSAMTIERKEEPVNTGPSVRRGGAVDGMSGGDINALAAAPANFNDYLSQQLQDAQFYASKDIYRGQRNVDNARALRGLGTDRLHQQMVDQQYNISGQ